MGAAQPGSLAANRECGPFEKQVAYSTRRILRHIGGASLFHQAPASPSPGTIALGM